MIDQEIDLLPARRSRVRQADAVTLLTFYLFFLIVIPSRLIFAPLGGAGAPSTILGAVFLIWYLMNWYHSSSGLDTSRQPMRVAGVLFLCVVIATYISATRHTLSGLAQNGVDRGIILTAGWIGILLLTTDGVASMDRLKTLIRRIVFGVTGMAVLGITQFFTGLNAAQYIIIPGLSSQQPYTDIQYRDSVVRPSATAIHPIEFGFVLAMVLPLAIHQARYAPRELRVRRWVQVALIAATLPMTVSRSAMLGLAVALIVILPTWPKRDRRLAYVVMLISLFALRTVIPGLIGTLRNLFLQIGTDSSTLSRTAAFGKAVPLLSAHPWLGQGFGTFLPNIFFFTDDQYLNSLIEMGAIGLLALLGLFACGWSLARRARRATADLEVRHLGQCLAASVAVAGVTYATFDALYFGMAAAFTFLLLGCTGAVWRLARVTQPDDDVQPELTASGPAG